MKSKLKKSLSLLLALVMCLSVMSVGAFATEQPSVEGAVASAIVGGITKFYDSLQEAINVADAGSTVELLSNVSITDYVNISKSLTIDGNNNTVNTTATRALRITANNVTLYLKDLSFVGNSSKTERGIQVDSNMTGCVLAIENCNVSGISHYGINICNGASVDITIRNSTISAWGALNLWSAGYAVKAYNSTFIGTNNNSGQTNAFATIVMEGDTTKATDLHAEDCTILLDGCTIRAINNGDQYQALLGFNGPSKSNSIVISGNTTVEMSATEGNVYFYYDGGTGNSISLGEGTYNFDPNGFVADGYEATYDESTQLYTVAAKDYVAQVVGGDKYETLMDAIDAVPDNGTATIMLLADVTAGSGLATSSANADGHPKNLTIDLGGFTYTVEDPAVGSTNTKSQAMHWAADSNITLKNGTIEASKNATGVKMMLQNYANLTLENITLDATYVYGGTYGTYTGKYAPWSNKAVPIIGFNLGTVTIKEGTKLVAASTALTNVNLEDGEYYSNVTIEGGEFEGAFIVEGATNYDNPRGSLTIKGGKFANDPEQIESIDNGVKNSYLADGYEATESDGTWTVNKQSEYTVDFTVPASVKVGNTISAKAVITKDGTKLTTTAQYVAEKANWTLAVDEDFLEITKGPTASASGITYTLRGVKAGTTTVTYKNVNDPALSYSAEVTIDHNLTVTFANSDIGSANKGAIVESGSVAIESVKLDGVEVDRNDYTFASENENVVTVNADAVTPLGEGTTYINVTLASDPTVTVRKYVKIIDAAAKINDTYYASVTKALEAATTGQTVELVNNVTESVQFTGNKPRVNDFALTIDLKGHTWTGASNTSWTLRTDYGIVTVKDSVGGGAVKYGKDYAFIVSHLAGEFTSKLILENGTFTGKTTVAQAGYPGGSGANYKYYGGELEILGGTFIADPDTNETYDANGNFKYLLNMLDMNASAYAGGIYSPSSITVKGGTFQKFDPSSNAAEGAGTNFVPVGYVSTENNSTWTVAKAADDEITVTPVTESESSQTVKTETTTAAEGTANAQGVTAAATKSEVKVTVGASETTVATKGVEVNATNVDTAKIVEKLVEEGKVVSGADNTVVFTLEGAADNNKNETTTGGVTTYTYEVTPYLTIGSTTEKIENAKLTNTVTFPLKAPIESGYVNVVHTWEAYVDANGNNVAAGSDTIKNVAVVDGYATITLSHFSTVSLTESTEFVPEVATGLTWNTVNWVYRNYLNLQDVILFNTQVYVAEGDTLAYTFYNSNTAAVQTVYFTISELTAYSDSAAQTALAANGVYASKTDSEGFYEIKQRVFPADLWRSATLQILSGGQNGTVQNLYQSADGKTFYTLPSDNTVYENSAYNWLQNVAANGSSDTAKAVATNLLAYGKSVSAYNALINDKDDEWPTD